MVILLLVGPLYFCFINPSAGITFVFLIVDLEASGWSHLSLTKVKIDCSALLMGAYHLAGPLLLAQSEREAIPSCQLLLQKARYGLA